MFSVGALLGCKAATTSIDLRFSIHGSKTCRFLMIYVWASGVMLSFFGIAQLARLSQKSLGTRESGSRVLRLLSSLYYVCASTLGPL